MKVRKFLLTIVVLLCSNGVNFAQLAYFQVIETVKQAQAQGKRQEESVLLLSQQGVTQAQLERIKSGYAQASGGITLSDKGERLEIITSEIQPIFPQAGKDDVFGRNMFNNKNLTFESNLNIPHPDNYKLSPDDDVIIDIWGNSETTIKQQISPEGSVCTSGLGPSYLNGKLMHEATVDLCS